MRARFEESRNEKDMRKCAAMVEAGEEEVFQNQAVSPFIYRNDEHGITFNRQAHIEDHLLNEWHPWEKVSSLLPHAIRKVEFLSKNSILTTPKHFHEFFTQFFF